MAWEVLNEQPAGDELIAVHAAVLPIGEAGQVVYFGDWSRYSGKTLTRILDLASGLATSLPDTNLPASNLFCAGQAFLVDGRLLVAGGRIPGGGNLPADHPIHATHEPGERACWTLNPRAGTWMPAHPLAFQPGSEAQGGGRWYPTLVTLGSGEVFAVAGHPAADDTFEGRHNNHTPERYAPTGDEWTPMVNGADRTASAEVVTDSYPRFHMTEEGALFCDTLGLHESKVLQLPRAYHPYGASWTEPFTIPIFDGFYDRGSAATSVLLPLLPSDGYRPRVLAVNGLEAYRIDAGAQDTGWSEVPPRVGDAANQRRDHGCAVLLPTGRVALVGGVQDSRTAGAQPAFQPELYDPGIDWQTATYGDLGLGPDDLGDWVDIGEDPAGIARGYHSTALLLPDGRVWTGGSTEVDDSPWPDEERRMEVWSPPYPAGERPLIKSSPQSIAYGAAFGVEVDVPSGDPVQRVTLMRCGSVTHAFDSDQRYVGLDFSSGAELTVTAPPRPEVAPPGFYTLWVVDAAGRPCVQAAFVRVCDQELDVLLERSTISRHEVVAMGTPATFVDAFYVVLDGFMPHELGDPLLGPEVTIEWLDGGELEQIALVAHPVGFEDPSLPEDRAQRVTFPYDLVVLDESLFEDVPDTPEGLEVRLRASWRHYEVERRLRLTLKANPRMNDGPVEWLSTDLRVFQARPGDQHEPNVTVGEDPLAFLGEVLDAWTDLPADDSHPFLDLAEQMDHSQLELSSHVGEDPVYNFAIAKVRMVAPEQVKAVDVRVFFRLFPTWSLGFEYDGETYPRSGDGGQALPQIGVLGGELRTIPFFAAPRGDDLLAPGDVDVNRHTLEGQDAQEVHGYFGCWLDFNHNAAVLSELRGDHPCLVAEVHYPDDPVGLGATPGTSDNLSQRNLAVVRAPNPASPETRLIDVTFTVTPSRFPPLPPGVGSPAARRRARADELMIRWGNLPPETHATIYWPDVDVDEIVAAAGTRLGPRVISRVDAHTISCRVGGTTYVPIPGPRQTDVPGLLTLELPPDLVKGQRFRMTAHQVHGLKRRIVGAVQLDVPIATAEEILPSEERKLGVLRWIAESLAAGDRWLPIFERWLGNVEGRVRGMGGDPDAIGPTGPGGDRPPPGRPGLRLRGKVRDLLYDCHGDFEGFVLEGCPEVRVFRSCERGVERVVQRACELRSTVTVHAERREPSRPQRIEVHCC